MALSKRAGRAMALALALAVTGSASGEPVAFELVDEGLERQTIRLLGFSEGRLRFFDASRQLREEPAERFVSLRSPGRHVEPDRDRAPHLLRLADGQSVHGRFAGADASGRLRWEMEPFGTLYFPLDDIVLLSLDRDAPPDSAVGGFDDVVVLVNSDLLEGFIEDVDDHAIHLDLSQRMVELPWDRVAHVVVANPIDPAPGTWITLADGSQVRIEQARLEGAALEGTAFGDSSARVPLASVVAIDFTQRHRLLEVGELNPRVVGGGRAFGIQIAPSVDGGTARLQAPVELEIETPRPGLRFAADARLRNEDLGWADLELIVGDGQGERFRQRLNRERPSVQLNVELRDRIVRIRLEEGANGPIRARLRLSDAVILIEGGS